MRFLHSPYPCGLATQGAVAESNAGAIAEFTKKKPGKNFVVFVSSW
jgi:hypothetical protein